MPRTRPGRHAGGPLAAVVVMVVLLLLLALSSLASVSEGNVVAGGNEVRHAATGGMDRNTAHLRQVTLLETPSSDASSNSTADSEQTSSPPPAEDSQATTTEPDPTSSSSETSSPPSSEPPAGNTSSSAAELGSSSGSGQGGDSSHSEPSTLPPEESNSSSTTAESEPTPTSSSSEATSQTPSTPPAGNSSSSAEASGEASSSTTPSTLPPVNESSSSSQEPGPTSSSQTTASSSSSSSSPTSTTAEPSPPPASSSSGDSDWTSTSTTPPTVPPTGKPEEPSTTSRTNTSVIIAVVVVVVVVLLLLAGAVTFYRVALGGTFGFLRRFFCCGGRKKRAAAADSEGKVNPLVTRAIEARNFPPCVADLPAQPILAPGDPDHINRRTNRPYTVNGIVPWTGRPPVLRGPQPACMVPTITPDGQEIPREERVLPGPLLYETPPATSELPPSPKPITKRQHAQNKWRARFGMKPFTDVIYPAPPRWYEGLIDAEWLPNSPVLSDDSASDDVDGRVDEEEEEGNKDPSSEKTAGMYGTSSTLNDADQSTTGVPIASKPTTAAAPPQVTPPATAFPFGQETPVYTYNDPAMAMGVATAGQSHTSGVSGQQDRAPHYGVPQHSVPYTYTETQPPQHSRGVGDNASTGSHGDYARPVQRYPQPQQPQHQQSTVPSFHPTTAFSTQQPQLQLAAGRPNIHNPPFPQQQQLQNGAMMRVSPGHISGASNSVSRASSHSSHTSVTSGGGGLGSEYTYGQPLPSQQLSPQGSHSLLESPEDYYERSYSYYDIL